MLTSARPASTTDFSVSSSIAGGTPDVASCTRFLCFSVWSTLGIFRHLHQRFVVTPDKFVRNNCPQSVLLPCCIPRRTWAVSKSRQLKSIQVPVYIVNEVNDPQLLPVEFSTAVDGLVANLLSTKNLIRMVNARNHWTVAPSFRILVDQCLTVPSEHPAVADVDQFKDMHWSRFLVPPQPQRLVRDDLRRLAPIATTDAVQSFRCRSWHTHLSKLLKVQAM